MIIDNYALDVLGISAGASLGVALVILGTQLFGISFAWIILHQQRKKAG